LLTVTAKQSISVRVMDSADLPAVRLVTDRAFCRVRQELYGRPVNPPAFPQLMYEYRLAANREGCFVASADGRIVGAVFSAARGTLGWFGPLATDPDVQATGIGQELVAACVDAWRQRDVRLMGLETFAASPFHVYLYAKLGFRPGWNGIAFTKILTEADQPDEVEIGGRARILDFIYPGLDPSSEVAATKNQRVGDVLVAERGLAICHTSDTFMNRPASSFVPLLAAETKEVFQRLLRAAEWLSLQAGNNSLIIRASGSCWATYLALTESGYRAGSVMVRMKTGDRLDYDGPDLYYCDNWL
jgi:predicted N-acetyltransferase YhbS